MENKFIKAVENATFTENGALSNKSTLSAIVDQFGKAGSFRGRSFSDVFEDQSELWDENRDYAVKFPFYLRAITRKTTVSGRSEMFSQVGQGARDESFKRILWLADKQKDVFERNIWLLPFVGSWKDLWQLMHYDKVAGLNCIDHKLIFGLLCDGLRTKSCTDLVKKFMPRIKSNKKCTTDWTKNMNEFAKEFANFMKMSYKEYNHLKTSGTAHEFQKLICARRFNDINWNQIPGKALALLTSGYFIEKHDLTETYMQWLEKSGSIKFTGYPYDLVKVLRNAQLKGSELPKHVEMTVNKQFDELIRKAKESNGGITGNVWCALDTSGSMTCTLNGQDLRAIDVCKSLGIFFSTLNTGAFHKHVIMFDRTSNALELSGDFTDMYRSIPNDAMGDTNFQSIVDEIVRIRKNHPSVPIEDYPQTLLVVSDMQFNPANSWWHRDFNEDEVRTNMQECKRKLYEVFPQEFVDGFKFIWWDCVSRRSDYPATIDDTGNYFFSGFDGSVITQLLGGKEKGNSQSITMLELIDKVLNQDIFKLIVVDGQKDI